MFNKQKESYDAKKYFESGHRTSLANEFSDGMTVSPDYNPINIRFYYNSVENSMLKYFSSHDKPKNPTVLDIGSGAGHWIDFYSDVFDSDQLVSLEISSYLVEALANKYKMTNKVQFVEGDISSSNFTLGDLQFDIVNAIGIMFHIVDDSAWETAIKNISNLMRKDGLFIISGQFGFITQDVQFHQTDEFNNWDEQENSPKTNILVNKRIRSLRYWKKIAARNGLKVESLVKTKQSKIMSTPENNILVLKKQ
ncbi:MAG: class I SAM-dependent methyltransferase [Bacteroidetes bacterium]|nr:class I SAM-dependent methyltransferase [Bacteroidota bacterium]